MSSARASIFEGDDLDIPRQAGYIHSRFVRRGR